MRNVTGWVACLSVLLVPGALCHGAYGFMRLPLYDSGVNVTPPYWATERDGTTPLTTASYRAAPRALRRTGVDLYTRVPFLEPLIVEWVYAVPSNFVEPALDDSPAHPQGRYVFPHMCGRLELVVKRYGKPEYARQLEVMKSLKKGGERGRFFKSRAFPRRTIITFSATSRPVLLCRARYTAPMPPWPNFESTL